jgi:2-haloacid dehalogenase
MSSTPGSVFPLPKALAFDVFGTVVDWHRGVAQEVAALAASQALACDAAVFANDWRDGYAPAMDSVRRGDQPWAHIDQLHRAILDRVLPLHGLDDFDEAQRQQLNRAWHRLPPWPDTLAGLTRLKRHFTLTTLSNGNFSLLTALAKHSGLPWDCVISAELFGHYKPDPETYLGCARLLDLAPAELMLVACHPSDLRAARALGLRTAYVRRPFEHGQDTPVPFVEPGEFELEVDDFEQLADRLGAI